MTYTSRLLVCEVLTCPPEETVQAAAFKMRAQRVGCLVVTQGKKIVGIFSERDLLNRVVAEGMDPASVKVADVMTGSPITIESTEPLGKAFSLLADGRFRHLPVTEKGELIGICSLTDLAKVLRQVYMDDKYLQYFADSIQRRRQGRI
jgi:CBS domain-containing protein